MVAANSRPFFFRLRGAFRGGLLAPLDEPCRFAVRGLIYQSRDEAENAVFHPDRQRIVDRERGEPWRFPKLRKAIEIVPGISITIFDLIAHRVTSHSSSPTVLFFGAQVIIDLHDAACGNPAAKRHPARPVRAIDMGSLALTRRYFGLTASGDGPQNRG